MPTFAAIDIGSNSCRLKIAKVVAHQLRTVHEDREVTRLGGSVFESGLISPESMALTLKTLKRFQRAVQEHGVDQIRVVATAAARDALGDFADSGVEDGRHGGGSELRGSGQGSLRAMPRGKEGLGSLEIATLISKIIGARRPAGQA